MTDQQAPESQPQPPQPQTPAETVAHLSRSGDAIIELVAGLRPADLEAGEGRVRRLAQVAIRHADNHRTEVAAALTAG